MKTPSIVLFDGECNLCNSAVAFVMKRDPRGRFRFASLQSEAGRKLVKECGMGDPGTDSVVLLRGGRCFTRSAAALRIARGLRGAWPLLAVFLLIPRPLRDRLYDVIAHHRYRWFGKAEQCLVPTPEFRNRFLE